MIELGGKMTIQKKTQFFDDVKNILSTARKQAYSAVNSAMVQAYWLIGKRIVEEEQLGRERAEYGKEIIKILSVELRNEFGRGFSERNLRNIRQFYLTFPRKQIWQTVSAKSENDTELLLFSKLSFISHPKKNWLQKLKEKS